MNSSSKSVSVISRDVCVGSAMISTASGKTASFCIIHTHTPKIPLFIFALAYPLSTNISAGCPVFATKPSRKFSTLALCDVIFPETVIWHPSAPADIILRIVPYADLLKCLPLSNEDASLVAITCAKASGSSSASTSIWIFFSPVISFIFSDRVLIVLPLLPIASPTLPTFSIIFVEDDEGE